jgi:hypothetical protein
VPEQSFLSYSVCPPEVAFGCEYSTGRTPNLPKSKQQGPEWQTAVEAMPLVVEHNGPTMMERIGVTRALNHGKSDPAIVPARKRAKSYRIVPIDRGDP